MFLFLSLVCCEKRGGGAPLHAGQFPRLILVSVWLGVPSEHPKGGKRVAMWPIGDWLSGEGCKSYPVAPGEVL